MQFYQISFWHQWIVKSFQSNPSLYLNSKYLCALHFCLALHFQLICFLCLGIVNPSSYLESENALLNLKLTTNEDINTVTLSKNFPMVVFVNSSSNSNDSFLNNHLLTASEWRSSWKRNCSIKLIDKLELPVLSAL